MIRKECWISCRSFWKPSQSPWCGRQRGYILYIHWFVRHTRYSRRSFESRNIWQKMKVKFIRERLETRINFFDPIKISKLKTFESTNKKDMVKPCHSHYLQCHLALEKATVCFWKQIKQNDALFTQKSVII